MERNEQLPDLLAKFSGELIQVNNTAKEICALLMQEVKTDATEKTADPEKSSGHPAESLPATGTQQ